MSCEENKKTVARFIDLISAWDVDGFFGMMADDAIWWVNGKPEDFPLAGAHPKAEMRQLLSGAGSVLKSPAVITIHGMIAEGDKVAVEAESHAETASGRKYNNQYHFLAELRDGKITTFKEYQDPQHVTKILLTP